MVLVAAAACGKGGGGAGGTGSGTGSGSGPGSGSAKPKPVMVDAAVAVAPTAPPAPVCFPADFNGRVDALVADDHAATICGTNDAKVSKCISIELGSGIAHDAPRPPAPPPVPTGGFAIQDDASTVALCKGSTCTKLALHALPPPEAGAPPSTPRITVAPGGTIAVAPLAEADKAKGLGMFDTSSGRRMKVLDAPTDDYACEEPARFLGPDVIYAVANVCAGPGARAHLYKLDGSPIGSLAPEYNVENGDPIHLDADTWAVPTLGGGQVLVFDAKTGRALRGIENIGSAFHACDGCQAFGPGVSWVSPLARTPSGKLVVASESGGISEIDPATGKIEKAWAFPVCAPVAAKPGG